MRSSHNSWTKAACGGLTLCLIVTFLICAQSSAIASGGRNLEVEKKVYNICAQSESAIASKNYDQAIALLRTAAADDPTSYSPYIHRKLAEYLRAQKSYQQAIDEAKLALKYDPKCDTAVYTIALCYHDLDRVDDCLKSLKQYVQMTQDPKSKNDAQQFIKKVSAFKDLERARKAIDAGKDKDALKLLSSAAAADPSPYSASVHASQSFVLRRMGNAEKAIDEGKKALEYDPQDKTTAYNIAIAYQDIAQFDDAISWLKRYSSMETDDAARTNAETFMHELEVDRKLFNSTDNQLPDYLEQMKTTRGELLSWPSEKLPLKVFISPGTGVKGYQPAFKNYVLKSFDTWYGASRKKLNYVIVNEPSKADIKITWTKDALETSNEAEAHRLRAGLTKLDSSNGIINRAHVRIRTVNAFDPNTPVKSGECAFVCMHEIGHALGLGHSTNIFDVMYFRSSTKQTGLPTKRDNATIARLYSTYTPVTMIAQAAPTPATTPITFVPPPAFVPPKVPETKSLAPPLFMPPPVASEKKLQPPMFTPPPLSAQDREKPAPKENKAVMPMFLPPPVEKKQQVKKTPAPAMFTPPPLKRGN